MTLPSVAFVDPRFVNDETGTSGSDHPHADVRVGDAFLAETFQAVANSPNWSSTVFIVTYDEWGGFFDHVPPTTAPDATPEAGTGMRGFRTPAAIHEADAQVVPGPGELRLHPHPVSMHDVRPDGYSTLLRPVGPEPIGHS